MKLTTLRDAKAKLGALVREARDELVVITRHGRPAAILEAIRPEDLEEILYETSHRFRSLIEERRRGRRAVPLAEAKKRLLSRRRRP